MTEELPLVLLFQTRAVSDGDRERLTHGEFSVRGQQVKLVPPLDWGMDPFDNLSWRFWLHTMQFLDGPLRIYEEDGDLEALASAGHLLVDWVDGNREGSGRAGDYAWTDMSAGIRASFLGYGWRECRRHELLDSQAEAKLTASVREHAKWLLADENYTASTNHGLYEDAGLFLMARYASELEEAEHWREAAENRFLATLAVHIDFEDGVHKEHSPGYQMYIRELVTRLHEEAGIGGAELSQLLPRLDDAAGWMVLPDGRQLPFGDTDPVEAPAFARERASGEGLRAFLTAGYAIMRKGSSYLAITGSYHTYAHKQADELSWCLYENGHLIVADPGRFSYHDESDPARVYARSSRGHNVLLVDGESFRWIDHDPYGSALEATAEANGWYAVCGANPLLPSVEHTRTLLYRPGEIVVVVDRVGAEEEHAVARRLQLGPGLEAIAGSGGVEISHESERIATMFVAGDGIEVEVASGVSEPEMDGWVFPRDKTKEPAPAITMRSGIGDGLLVHGLAIAPLDAAASVRLEGDELLVEVPGTEIPSVVVRMRDGELGLEQTASI